MRGARASAIYSEISGYGEGMPAEIGQTDDQMDTMYSWTLKPPELHWQSCLNHITDTTRLPFTTDEINQL